MTTFTLRKLTLSSRTIALELYHQGAVEELAWDPLNNYLYLGSKVGYLMVVDYQDPSDPKVTNYALDMTELGEINDIAICAEKGWLFVSIKEAGIVQQYQTVQRDDPKDPILKQDIPVGPLPFQVLPNPNCTIVAVSNENDHALTHGTVTLVRDLESDEPSTTSIAMDGGDGIWDDDYTLRKGLHMPLTSNALKYWDELSFMKDELDFANVRENYRSSIFIEGESLAWMPDGSEVLINLQVNNGILRIDAANNRALALAGYGLKDHATVPIDINSKDKACNLKTYPNLFSMRNPDSAKTFRYNGKNYLVTANEGGNKVYGDWEDEIKGKDVFAAQEFMMPRMRAPSMYVLG